MCLNITHYLGTIYTLKVALHTHGTVTTQAYQPMQPVIMVRPQYMGGVDFPMFAPPGIVGFMAKVYDVIVRELM